MTKSSRLPPAVRASKAAQFAAQALLSGLLCLLAGGCLSIEWSRTSRSREVAEFSQLEVGGSDLRQALELLGAPLWVYEHRVHGAALVYGRSVFDTQGFNISVPLGDMSASLDYTEGETGLRGVLLLFDADLRLTEIREGFLHDLAAGRRARPAVPQPNPSAKPQE
jgi:hypothetical protein